MDSAVLRKRLDGSGLNPGEGIVTIIEDDTVRCFISLDGFFGRLSVRELRDIGTSILALGVVVHWWHLVMWYEVTW